ncbi:hypothetical protein HDU99_006256, partial [Rhizoclosmatium hyalinum]
TIQPENPIGTQLQQLFKTLSDSVSIQSVEIEKYWMMFEGENAIQPMDLSDQEATPPPIPMSSKTTIYSDGPIQRCLYDVLLQSLVALLSLNNTSLQHQSQIEVNEKNRAFLVSGIDWMKVLPQRYRDKKDGFYEISQVLLRTIKYFSDLRYSMHLPRTGLTTLMAVFRNTTMTAVEKDLVKAFSEADPMILDKNMKAFRYFLRGLDDWKQEILESTLSKASSCPSALMKYYRDSVHPSTAMTFLLCAEKVSASFSWRYTHAKTLLSIAPKDLGFVMNAFLPTFE